MRSEILSALLVSSTLAFGFSACSGSVESRMAEARTLIDADRGAEAVELLDGISLDSDPEHALWLSRAHASANDFRAADETLEAGLAAHPGDAALTGEQSTLVEKAIGSALELAREERGAEGITRLEAVLAWSGPDPEVSLSLGRIHETQNAVPKAVTVYRDALETAPAHPELVQSLTLLYNRFRQYPKSQVLLERAREHGLGDDAVSMILGVTLGRMGNLEGARQEFARAEAAGSDRNHLDYNLSLLYSSDQRHDEARVLLEGVLERDPANAAAMRELARTLVVVGGDLEQALSLAWTASDALPDDWRCYEVLGDVYMAQGDFVAAVETFENGLRLGRNPRQVEEKYVIAKRALNAQMGSDDG